MNRYAGLQAAGENVWVEEKKGVHFPVQSFLSSIPGLERDTWVKKHLKRDLSKYRVNMYDAVFPFWTA